MEKSPFKNKKALVTGASGFIGSHLIKYLHDAGAEIHGVSRKNRKKEVSGIRWWKGDLSNIDVVKHIIKSTEPDYIFHLAGHVMGARTLENVIPAFTSILSSTINVMTVAAEVGCQRIILAGSLEEPEITDTEVIPSSPYAAAKWSASAYARMFHALYGTPVTIARIFMVYGPGHQDLRKLIPYVTLSLLRGKTPTLTSGTRQIDWIYVEDVAKGLLSLAASGHVSGCTIDLGSGSLLSIRDLVHTLVDVVDSKTKPVFGSIADREMEQVRAANIRKTCETIDWKPEVGLKNGLEITVDWYRALLRSNTLF